MYPSQKNILERKGINKREFLLHGTQHIAETNRTTIHACMYIFFYKPEVGILSVDMMVGCLVGYKMCFLIIMFPLSSFIFVRIRTLLMVLVCVHKYLVFTKYHLLQYSSIKLSILN